MDIATLLLSQMSACFGTWAGEGRLYWYASTGERHRAGVIAFGCLPDTKDSLMAITCPLLLSFVKIRQMCQFL